MNEIPEWRQIADRALAERRKDLAERRKDLAERRKNIARYGRHTDDMEKGLLFGVVMGAIICFAVVLIKSSCM